MFELIQYGRKLTSGERNILLSQSFSAVSDFMALPAFLIIAQNHSYETVAYFLFFYFIPKFFQPLLGYITDIFNPKSIVVFTDSIRCIIFLTLTFLEINTYLIPWYLLVVLNSSLSSIAEPARFKLLTLVSRNFTSYNSIFNFSLSIVGILSLIASIIIEIYFETLYVFLFNSCIFFLSTIILALISINNPNIKFHQHKKRSFHQWLAGIHYFRKTVLGFFLMGIFICDFLTGMIYAWFPIKSEHINLETIGTYIFTLILCIGNATGALTFTSFKDRERFFPWMILIATISCLLFINMNSVIIVVISCFIFFVVQMILIGCIEVEIEKRVPHNFQGRAFAIGDSLPILSLSLGGMAIQEIPLDILSFTLLVFCFLFCLIYTASQSFHSKSSPQLKTEEQ